MYDLATIRRINEEAYSKHLESISERKDRVVTDMNHYGVDNDISIIDDSINPLSLEEMLIIANKIKIWRSVQISVPEFNKHGSRQYKNCMGFAGTLEQGVRIETARDEQEAVAYGHEKICGSTFITYFCLRAFKDKVKIGDCYVLNPTISKYNGLITFYEMYDELENRTLVKEKEKRLELDKLESEKRKTVKISIEDARDYIEDLRRRK